MPRCNVCNDDGYFRADVDFGHPQFGKLIRCDCMASADAQRIQQLSGLSDTERACTIADIDTQNRPGTALMVRACRMFIESPVGIITIWGGCGNAKTLALQAVVNHFVSVNCFAVYITAFDLISYIRSAFNNQREIIDENAWQRLTSFERVKILAIDELDKVRVTDWVKEQLTDLIDRRYRLGLDGTAGTLIAMNDDPHTLPSWIYSRLAQNMIVNNSDNDMRPLLGQQLTLIPATGEMV
jgi:hypothetical protein